MPNLSSKLGIHLKKSPKTSKTIREGICIGCLMTIFIGLASWSWRMWPDVLIDFGHELYVPWQVIEGKLLYRDLMFTMGPLSQYFNALLFYLFGVSLNTLIYCNLLILILVTSLIYRIFPYICSEFETTVICGFFLTVFGFSQYTGASNYNYICPYRHEMTHGIFLLLSLLLTFFLHAKYRNNWLISLAGFFCGLTFLTKTEIFMAGSLLSLFALGFQVIARGLKSWGFMKIIMLFSLGLIFPIVTAILMLSPQLSLETATRYVLANIVFSTNPELTTNYKFYIENFGFDDIRGNVILILRS